MFVDIVNRRNRPMIDATLQLYNENLIQPDSYIIDVDTVLENAKIILKAQSVRILDYILC